MNDPTQPLLDVITKALSSFKEGNYDAVQDALLSKEYRRAMQNLGEEQAPLKEAMIGLWEHIGIATNPTINTRLDDNTVKTLTRAVEELEKEIKERIEPSAVPKNIPLSAHIQRLDRAFHRVVENISEMRLDQAQALSQHERALFEDLGVAGYWKELVQRRWLGDHHAGDIEQITKTITPPTVNLNQGGLQQTFGAMPSPAATPTTKTIEIALEGKALEEFGNVTVLDTPLKKIGAGLASVAGVGLVAHGVRNMYLAFQPDNTTPLEVAELEHTPPSDGINWLRLVVGAGEIGAGAATLHRQLTGRWGIGAIEGKAEALCTHGAPTLGGR